MGEDKRRRSPSRSPPPRGGRDALEDGRGAGRDSGRFDSRDYDKDRERDRDRDRDRGRESGRDGRRGGAYDDPEPRGGAARRDDRGAGGGGPKREPPAERDRDGDRGPGGDYRGGGGGRGGVGGAGGREPKRERVDGGDWGASERPGGGRGRGGGGGGGGAGGRERETEASRYMSREEREAKEREAEEAAKPKAPKEQPNLGLSGKLAAETNKTATGVQLKHVPPPEARKPDKRWRLYIFKNDQLQDEPYRIHRMDHYLFGRDVAVADIVTAHPSCSKQHAVLQFRLVERDDKDTGLTTKTIRPYLLDLGSVNGTFLNGERLEALRYYELLEKDVMRFGQSTREYVLLHDESGGD